MAKLHRVLDLYDNPPGDGRVTCGQGRLFAAMLHEEKVIIAQHAIPEDTNEITQVKQLLDPVDLDGAVVTGTAVAQHATADYIAAPQDEEKARIDALAGPVTQTAPRLLALHGVGIETAAALLVTAGDNPGRLRSEAAWAHPCGTAPIPASWGKVTRCRRNRGDRQANGPCGES
jgi:hypothetical protein